MTGNFCVGRLRLATGIVFALNSRWLLCWTLISMPLPFLQHCWLFVGFLRWKDHIKICIIFPIVQFLFHECLVAAASQKKKKVFFVTKSSSFKLPLFIKVGDAFLGCWIFPGLFLTACTMFSSVFLLNDASEKAMPTNYSPRYQQWLFNFFKAVSATFSSMLL